MKERVFFDSILSDRIGMGRCQYWGVLAAGFLWMSDGSELFLIGFTLPLIKKEWDIENGNESYLGTAIFFGILVGNLLSGAYSDRIGRKEPFIMGSLLILVSSILSALCGSFGQLLFFRFFFGVGMGSTVPLIPTYLSEIIPKDKRGGYTVFSGLAFPLGELIVLLIIWNNFNSLEEGNWRLMVLLAAFPSLLAILILVLKCVHSARFELINKSDVHSAVQILDQMGETNHPETYKKITGEEVYSLVEYQKYIQATNSVSHEISELFKPQHRKMTFLAMVMWYSLSFAADGLSFIIPSIILKLKLNEEEDIEQMNNDYTGIMFMLILGILGNVITSYLIEESNFGRKKLLMYSYLAATATLFVLFLQKRTSMFFYLLTGLTKFFVSVAYSVQFTFTSEIYPTNIRTLGVSFNSAFSSVGASMMPLLSYLFFKLSITGPFLIIGIVTLLSTIAAFQIPKDTLNMELDIYSELQDFPPQKNN